VDRRSEIEQVLRDAFAPEHLEVEDESAAHRGHAGFAPGGSHFRVVIVSGAFRTQDLVTRQRAVHAALARPLAAGVHALALRTLTPEEWRAEA
jgi:BolA protein